MQKQGPREIRDWRRTAGTKSSPGRHSNQKVYFRFRQRPVVPQSSSARRDCGNFQVATLPRAATSHPPNETFPPHPHPMRDAIGFIVNGQRVTNTGSGGDSDFLRRSYNLPPLPPNTWIATVVYANGRRANLPVALRTPEGERPYPGVKWIFPPTLVHLQETIVG